MGTIRVGAVVIFLVASGCSWTTFDITPSGKGVTAEQKAPDCQIGVYRTPINRSYDEIAAIRVEGGSGMFYPLPEELQKELKSKACLLGADAVIISQEYTRQAQTAVMTGVAVRFRE